MRKEEFEDLLDSYLSSKRETMRFEYNRVLPTGELLFNRFDKSKYLGFGENTSIYDTSVVLGDVKIGDHVWIGPYTLLDGSGEELVIGDYVSIDTGVLIYTHDSTKNYVSGGVNPFIKGKVLIGSNTVLGSMTVVSCGTTIGNHCVIGAQSFVNKDIPDYSIAVGNPIRIIGNVIVDEEGAVDFDYFD